METLKYISKEEIMTLPSHQRKRYLKKLKNYKRKVRIKEAKEQEKMEARKKKQRGEKW